MNEELEISLSLNDLRHLVATEGYIELGMYQDADAELERIDPFCRDLPQVLALKLCIYGGLQNWELMQTVAQKMAQHDPCNVQWAIFWSLATRQVHSIEAARAILLRALEKNPNEPSIHYNLSCYESRLHHFKQARRHLARAIQLDGRFRLIALDEHDLEPLWKRIGHPQVCNQPHDREQDYEYESPSDF
jgi:tetratricopeptide (TPR) repeat protein